MKRRFYKSYWSKTSIKSTNKSVDTIARGRGIMSAKLIMNRKNFEPSSKIYQTTRKKNQLLITNPSQIRKNSDFIESLLSLYKICNNVLLDSWKHTHNLTENRQVSQFPMYVIWYHYYVYFSSVIQFGKNNTKPEIFKACLQG